jgi:hypothetical protein
LYLNNNIITEFNQDSDEFAVYQTIDRE